MRRFYTWLAVLGFVLAAGPVQASQERCSALGLDEASLQVRHLPPHLRPERGPGDPECTAEANPNVFPADSPWLGPDVAAQPCPPAGRRASFLGAGQGGPCGRAGSDPPPATVSCGQGTWADPRHPLRLGGPGPTGSTPFPFPEATGATSGQAAAPLMDTSPAP
jgi:hypothetical protein